jgi:hypothetical protein
MENHGALVGWGHYDNGDRLLFRMETVQSNEALNHHDPDVLRVLMSKQQAFVLGNYLINLSGQTAIDQNKRSWFRRLFG